MPTDRHLEYIEIPDFSPGLHDAGSTFLVPSTGWRKMEDCRPEPSGGLRAAFKPTEEWDLSTISSTVRSHCEILAVMEITSSERYIWLRYDNAADTTDDPSGTYDVRIYWWNGTTWDQLADPIAYLVGDTKPRAIMADTFTDVFNIENVEFIIDSPNADAQGLWVFARNSSAAPSNTYSGAVSVMAVNDDRILINNGGRTLFFSDSLDAGSIETADFLVIQGSRFNSAITGILPISPSDIMIGTNGAVWSRVQGDIASSPTVRGLSDAHPCTTPQQLHLSDAGVPFIEDSRGIYVTGDGSQFECISTQLDGNHFQTDADLRTVGSIVNCGTFLFAPGGYVFDLRTKSWFTLSDINVADTGFVSFGHRQNGRVIVATKGTSPHIYSYDTDESHLAHTWTARTAPIRSTDGRRVRIRQVEVPLLANHDGDTLAVTVNGHTLTHTLEAGRGTEVFYFNQESEMLDVTITATANTVNQEAPMIEVLRIGKNQIAHRSL